MGMMHGRKEDCRSGCGKFVYIGSEGVKNLMGRDALPFGVNISHLLVPGGEQLE
jgi:hypothetical protein